MNQACLAGEHPQSIYDLPARFGVLEAGPVTPSSETPGETTDGYGFRLIPLRFAYVIFADRQPEAYSYFPPFAAGRTNNAGFVFARLAHRDFQGSFATGVLPEIVVGCPTTRYDEVSDRVISWSPRELPDDPHALSMSVMGIYEGMYWTYHRDVWDEVVEALARDQTAAFDKYRFVRLRESARTDDGPVALHALSELERRKVSQLLLTNGEETCFLHAELPSNGRSRPRPSLVASCAAGVVFDVTPKPMRALYATEWAVRYAIHLRKVTLRDWGTLLKLNNIMAAYQREEPIPELEQELLAGIERAPFSPASMQMRAPSPTPLGTPGNPAPIFDSEAPQRAAQLRSYANQCARERVDPEKFSAAIAVSRTNAAWISAANAINAQWRVQHPWLDPSNPLLATPGTFRFSLSERAQTALKAYFDMFVFARGQIAAGVDRDIDAHLRAVDVAQRWVEDRCRERMARDCPHIAFSAAISQQTLMVDDLGTSEAEMLARYVNACGDVRYPFWTEAELDRFEGWYSLAPHLKWAGKDMSKIASVLKLVFRRFVRDFSALLTNAEICNKGLNYLFRYHLTLENNGTMPADVFANNRIPTAIESIRAGTHFEVDFDRGEVRFRLPDDDAQSLPFHFLRRVEPMPADEARSPRGNPYSPGRPAILMGPRAPNPAAPFAYEGPVRFTSGGWVIDRTVNEFQVTMPCASSRSWRLRAVAPGWLKLAADGIRLVFSAEKVLTEVDHAGGKTFFEVTRDVLSLAGSFDAVYLNWRTAQRITHPSLGDLDIPARREWVGAALSRAATAYTILDSGLDLYEGATIIVGQDPNMRAALRRSDGALATALRVKGVLQISSGILGGYTLAQTAAGAAIAPPVAVAVVVLGVLILAADQGMRLMQDDLAPFRDAVLEAREREFRRPLGQSAGADPGPGAHCVTRLALGSLNAALRWPPASAPSSTATRSAPPSP